MIRLRPERMRHITLYLVRESVPDVSLHLARFGWFNPIPSNADSEVLPSRPDSEYQNTYARARKRLDKILHFTHLSVHGETDAIDQMLPLPELQDLDERLGELWQHCSRLEEQQRKVSEELRHTGQLQNTLQEYRALNIDLGRLQQPHTFLDIRLGTVPLSEVNKLRDALSLNNYLLTLFRYQENQAHVVIAGDREQAGNIARVLEAASFRTTSLPAEFHDYPERLQQQLSSALEELQEEQQQLKKRVRQTAQDNRDVLEQAQAQLNIAEAYAELSGQLASSGALGSLQGWVPRARLAGLRSTLMDVLGDRFVLAVRAPRLEERSRVPSYTEHAAFLRPFAGLVKNYGVPRYGEFDPTWLFALSYILMFGMMFGDIGHGLMIMLGSLLLRGKLTSYRPFFVAIGLSSSLFGFVYGSLFGFEEIIPAWWMSPLHDPVLMLTVALGWGIGFIMLMVLLSIRNHWIDGDYRAALFSGHGAAGLLLYGGLLLLGWQGFSQGEVGAAGAGLAGLSLLAILVHGWVSSSSSRGERTLVILIEAFETVIGYFSNTLSFLRVAAFSINHVALIVAVFTVANMFDSTGQWITIVLGNLFVLVLEGAIVAIQVLRLEYYEGFSRFYRGDGQAFRPLVLRDAG
ncbi:MAG: V-type ATPase 116kDa subunit family protein [Thiohalophilus sp.]|uniref:V-type ATP synthase subunit I n=1 Tax=Thiohalophilus sp. TaxID=3028392 RepID=UPI00287061D2|nr:V-type ATPase 116kDa subunit family protein [Thiohalophilus sp.]MDR9435787.1 V-type ATPase 116kDa subunit family protein [Thiohalophilus sp.]